MASWYLLNSTVFGNKGLAVRMPAGTLVNDAIQPLAPIQAAGGIFAPSTNAKIAAAAAVANKRQKQGAGDAVLNAIMLSAASTTASVPARGTATSNAGATVAAGAALAPAVAFTPVSSGKVRVRAWASCGALASGTITPVLEQGGAVIAAAAQYTGATGSGPYNPAVEVEIDGLTVGTAYTFSWLTTAGDATATLGHGSTGVASGLTVEEIA